MDLGSLGGTRVLILGGKMKRKNILSLALAGMCLFAGASASERIEVENTSVNLVETYANKERIYLADRNELSDALGGAVLAGEEGAGLLTIDPENPSQEELDIIKNAESLIILGGEARIPASYEEFGNFEKRYKGETRYSTAASLAQVLGTDRNLVIASGTSYVDALTSSPLAIVEDRNMILVEKDFIPEESLAYLREHGSGKDLIFIGGDETISREIKEKILGLVDSFQSLDSSTIAGEDRYDTSLKIARRLGHKSSIIVSSAFDMESALNSINMLGTSPVTLVANKENLDSVLERYGQTTLPEKVYTLGSPENWVEEVHLSGEFEEISIEELEEPEEEKKAPAQIFMDEAFKMKGWAYSQSQRNQNGYADCSSLVNKALINSGLTTDKRNLTSGSIFSDPRFTRVSFNDLRPGDVLHSPGHLAIFVGDGQVFEAKTWGVPAGYGSYAYRGWNAAFRIKGL